VAGTRRAVVPIVPVVPARRCRSGKNVALRRLCRRRNAT